MIFNIDSLLVFSTMLIVAIVSMSIGYSIGYNQHVDPPTPHTDKEWEEVATSLPEGARLVETKRGGRVVDRFLVYENDDGTIGTMDAP